MIKVNFRATSALLALGALTPPLAVQAHDTWFVPGKEAASYHLNTGSHFPQLGGPVPFSRLAGHGCIDLDGQSVGNVTRGSSREFVVSLADVATNTHSVCWASLSKRSITLNPREVKQYLAETRAGDQWREHYRNLQAQGKDWRESYRKSARMELTTALSSALVDLPFQARLAPSSAQVTSKANQPITLQVLLNEEPLAGQPVELLVDNAPVGLWYETDTQGYVEVVPPVSGQALLRGTHFALNDGAIQTEFLTYTFTVAQ